MRKTAFMLVFTLLVPLGLALTGCGDSNLFKSISNGSSESKIEEAVEALDEGNYQKAVTILTDASDSDAKRKYLASAYLGLAGFDTLELIAVIDEAREAAENGGGDPNSVIWSAAGSIFEDDELKDGLLTPEEVDAKIANLDNALSVLFTGEIGNDWYALLEGVGRVGPTQVDTALIGFNDARLFQTGLASAMHGLLKVSRQLLSGGYCVIDPVTFVNFYQAELPSVSELPEGFMDRLVDDLYVLAASLERMDESSDNSLLEDLNQLLIDIGYANDGVVTEEELNNFLQTVAIPGGTPI